MTFALKELSRLLTADRSLLGAVVGDNAGFVRVATERGAVTARALDALVVGDRVHVQNGVATKAPVARQAFPV